MSIFHEINKQLIEQLESKIDSLIVQGLSLKGYDFNSREEIIDFISKNCTCKDNVDAGIRIYCVNEVPFFEHRYKTECSSFLENVNEFKITIGDYKFL